MIQVFLLLACFVGYIFLQHRFLRVPSAVAPALSVGLLISILFCADFVGMLEPATYVFYFVGWAGAGMFLYLAVVGRIGTLQPDTVRMAAFGILAFLWLYRVNHDGAFHEWDEFSHWGSVIKAIYGANTFHFNPNPLYFQDYPPGAALFSYFVLKLLGYSEGGAYFSYGLILLAFALPVIGLVAQRGLVLVLGYSALILVLVSRNGLGQGWSTTGIDHVLSIIFGGAIAAYFILRRAEAPLWPLPFMLIVLVLTKHAGQSLTMLVAALIATDLLVSEMVHEHRPWLRRPSGETLRRIILMATGLLAPPLLIGWYWRHYVTEMGLAQGFGRHTLSKLLARSADCCASARDLKIVTGFVDKMLGVTVQDGLASAGSMVSVAGRHLLARGADITIAGTFSPVIVLALLTAVGVVAMRLADGIRDKARIGVATGVLSAGAIAFSVSLLLFYLYAFSEVEAVGLASFDRFQKTYYLGWALAAMAMIALALDAKPVQRAPGTLAAVFLVVLGLLPMALDDQKLRRLRLAPPPLGEERAAIRKWVLPQLTGIPDSASVYVIWQGTSGIEFWMIRHEALPRVANNDCFSLGPPQFKGDIWSCPRTEKEVAGMLAGYRYLIVGHGLASLKAMYPSLLTMVPSGIERGLLKIETAPGVEGVSLNLVSGDR